MQPGEVVARRAYSVPLCSHPGQFYGNSPVNLKLKPGKHTIEVKLSGYKNWTREISTEAGSSANLVAEMEKAN